MSSYKKITLLITLFGLFQIAYGQIPTAEELVGIHPMTETQINTISNPIIGTLVYNTDLNSMQTFTGAAWVIPESISTFVDNLDGTFTYTDESNTSITIGTIGAQGPPGPQGQTGNAGPQGQTGDTGAQGQTGAQGSPGPQGTQGQTGNAGPQGQTGDIGAQGQTGNTGAQGQTGTQGPPGPQGQTGNTGPQGQTGDPGAQGPAGNTGAQGPTGPQGPAGNSSTVNKIIDVYDSNASYVVNANTFLKVRLNTTRINLGGIYKVDNNDVIVGETGTYEIEYGVAAKTNVWSSIEAKIRVNNNYLTATSSYNGGWYKNSTATRKIYQNLNANDVISIWVQRIDQQNSGANSVNIIPNGSYLLIRKLN